MGRIFTVVIFLASIIIANYPEELNAKKLFGKNKMGSLENFETHRIKGEVIDEIPPEKLVIEYSSGVSVELGNELKPTEVKDEPKYSFKGQADKLYTLVFVDPDAISQTFLHGIINNIPGSDFSKGDVAAEYVGSGPPKGTGKHRYIFLVYEQPDGKRINVQNKIDKSTVTGRKQFDVKKYVKDNGLGKLVAGNFYIAEYDDYVPILHSQFRH